MLSSDVTKELTYNKNPNLKNNQMIFIGNWMEEKCLKENFNQKDSFQRTMIRDLKTPLETEAKKYGENVKEFKKDQKQLEKI